MIPEGDYLAIAISPLASGDSNKKGTKYLTTTFRIEQDGGQKGAMIEWNGWLTDTTQERVATSLALCGFDGIDPATVMTNKVKIVIKHEDVPDTNPPRKEARVAWINDPNRGSSVGTLHDATKQAEVFAGLRGLILIKKEEMAKKQAVTGEGVSFGFGANVNGAPPPMASPQAAPAPVKAPPKF